MSAIFAKSRTTILWWTFVFMFGIYTYSLLLLMFTVHWHFIHRHGNGMPFFDLSHLSRVFLPGGWYSLCDVKILKSSFIKIIPHHPYMCVYIYFTNIIIYHFISFYLYIFSRWICLCVCVFVCFCQAHDLSKKSFLGVN